MTLQQGSLISAQGSALGSPAIPDQDLKGRTNPERGCVESDEISRSNATEFLACDNPAMVRRKAEGMIELVETGLKPLHHHLGLKHQASNLRAFSTRVDAKLGHPKKDVSLDHEPGCKGFKWTHREWTPMDTNVGQSIEKILGLYSRSFAFIRA